MRARRVRSPYDALPSGWRRVLAVGGLAVMAALGGSPTPALAAPAERPPPADETAAGRETPADRQSPAGRTAAGVPVLDWTGCDGGFQCATAEVPLDHRKPDGRTIRLALIKWPAADPSTRIGSLFLNPGGPGGSGINFLRTAPPVALQVASRRFDVVSWDPRGVGASTRIDCGHDYDFPDALPRPGRTDEAAWVRASRDFGHSCVRTTPDLRFFSTADTVRDLDLLRRAVGDEKLSYLGVSYGTVIGATYASLFPGRARALVLDGAVDPQVYFRDPIRARQEQTAGFERSLYRFFMKCAAAQAACGNFGDGDPEAAFDRLVARADVTPIPAGAGATLTGDDILSAANVVAYSASYWPFFGVALARAEAGDGSLVKLLTQGGGGLSADASEVIRALDMDYPRSPKPLLAAGRFAAVAWPHTGWLSGYLELDFALFPQEAAAPYRGPFRNPGAPALVVGTTYDPATPYAWAQRLTAQLGNARLLTYEGDGHAAIPDLNGCVLGASFSYLETGVLPAEGTVCRQADPFATAAATSRRATLPDGWDWEIEARRP